MSFLRKDRYQIYPSVLKLLQMPLNPVALTETSLKVQAVEKGLKVLMLGRKFNSLFCQFFAIICLLAPWFHILSTYRL